MAYFDLSFVALHGMGFGAVMHPDSFVDAGGIQIVCLLTYLLTFLLTYLLNF